MRKWKIYLLYHTQFDIGYTGTQNILAENCIQLMKFETALVEIDGRRRHV